MGLNLSRACTLAFARQGEVLSVGRVQTPTLAILVQREEEILNFKVEEFLLLKARFNSEQNDLYRGIWFKGKTSSSKNQRLPIDGQRAAAIQQRVQHHSAQINISQLKIEPRSQEPPQLYDLTELQRHANRLYGFSADKTLKLAQELYEKEKLISYPRTDSRYLSKEVAHTLPPIVEKIRSAYNDLIAAETGQSPLGKRFINDAKINDHHAIIPNGNRSKLANSSDAGKLYDLLCRRLLAAWQPKHRYSQTTLITTVQSEENGQQQHDTFHSSGQQILQLGWKSLEVQHKSNQQTTPSLPALKEGQTVQLAEIKTEKSQTRPPPRLNDASLLTAMESAGRSLDEKELAEAMRENGLGTPATRAEMIENLLRRGYLERQGKLLHPTERGLNLIKQVPKALKTPLLTGQWEAQLQQIQQGKTDLTTFMQGIETYVKEAVDELFALPTATKRTLTPIAELPQLLKSAFKLDAFRPHQEEVCQQICAGHDLLLVMPTGAGKSLCYQLPGLARAGTTLVISPLIALMEDQVGKLQELGLNAERIHSGLSREHARQICRNYLHGLLDYLFIAPERLKVPGFGDMLAKRKPQLIAVDEAHCISQWGHDFRPDYRLLHQHLPKLAPAPIIALTATATPEVQADICQQLGKPDAQRFIHGFRRHNIAIQVNELAANERSEAVVQLLDNPKLRPAIVYAASRKEANELAETVAQHHPCAAYHAGMLGENRDAVQRQFLQGELEVIVATVAFGMGVDKADIRCVIHTALPASVENYYQEIGRAGRDGQESHAVLLYAYADRRTHEFFLKRDYPPIEQLESIHAALNEHLQEKQTLAAQLQIKGDEFERMLEKLWIHGAAQITPDEQIVRGESQQWQPAYQRQKAHRQQQLEKIFHYAQGQECRMLALIQHFGDESDSQQPCGLCDVCQPQNSLLTETLSPATVQQQHVIECLILGLRQRNAQSSGQLHKQFGEGLTRRDFERLLTSLRRAELISLQEDTFETEGKQIHFVRVHLSEQSRNGRIDYAAIQLPQFGKTSKKKSKPRKKAIPIEPLSPLAQQRLQRLTQWRLETARREKVPAFRIFSDKTLLELASVAPDNPEALLQIAGIGAKKVENYSAAVFRVFKETEV
ncbi:MAG: RecQ family ATP-dependent DNA helicase [Gammaproteobacteria bacterium]|nr:RecQ family ATP-dependent DNA helicase [Gammaproteobacteria bacterium]